jgi:hypothetical protein
MINAYLIVAYMTILDKYAIVNIFILCMVACWHGIVASFWDDQTTNTIDKCLLISFSIGILLINLLFVFWFFNFKMNIWKLEKMEKEFTSSFNETEQETLKIMGSNLNVKSKV